MTRHESAKQPFPWWEAPLIALLAVLCYYPALHGTFVFDDWILIVQHPLIHAADGLRRIWFTAEAPDYYPIAWTALWLQWHLWGASPLGFHIVNLILHVVNAILIVRLLRHLGVPGALFAGLVFVMHPVNVSSVAWIIEQKSTLAMLFFLLTALAYLNSEETNNPAWYWLSLAAYVISLLAKPAAIMWPIVVLGLALWKRDRLALRDFLRSLPFLVVSAVLAVVTVWFQAVRVLGGQPAVPAGLATRFAIAGRAIWFYLLKVILPLHLTMIYPKWTINPSSFVSFVPALLAILLLLLLWWNRRSWGHPFLAGFGFFILMLFPVLGFFDQGFYRYSYVADHWLYLPIIGIFALLASESTAVLTGSPQSIKTVIKCSGAWLLLILGVLTWSRAQVYQDEKTLWQDTIDKNPTAWLAWYNLGVTLGVEGKPADAEIAYEAALRLKPDYTDAIYNLGMTLAQQGHEEEGIQCWLTAVHEQPDYDEAHNNLGAAYAQRGEFKKAILHLSLVLILKPHDATAHANLGTLYLQQGNWGRAITEFQCTLKEDPSLTPVRLNLALALARSGNITEATATLQNLLSFEPNNPDARSLLNQLLARSRSPDAVK